jgi:hypothetical protein
MFVKQKGYSNPSFSRDSSRDPKRNGKMLISQELQHMNQIYKKNSELKMYESLTYRVKFL